VWHMSNCIILLSRLEKLPSHVTGVKAGTIETSLSHNTCLNGLHTLSSISMPFSADVSTAEVPNVVLRDAWCFTDTYPRGGGRPARCGALVRWLILQINTNLTQSSETLKPLTNEYYQSMTTLRANADIHVNKSTLQRRTPPDWKFEDQFEFYGFWLLNEEHIVSNALTGVMDLLETTMKVLSGTSGEGLPYGEEDPSFQRYFRKGNLDQVGAIFQRVLGILGAPGTSAIRQCIEASKLLLIYGDGPNSNRNCADETRGVFAYYNAFEDSNKTPRSYLAFCKRFFDSYKAHKPISWDPSIPYVDSAKMGTSIDIADPSRLPEAESGASIVLHGKLIENESAGCVC